jgi:mRNA interferase MazF
MGAFATGQVVILPFPFSDLTRNKYRPVLLLANVGRGDWIVCQITSKDYGVGCADEGGASFAIDALCVSPYPSTLGKYDKA